MNARVGDPHLESMATVEQREEEEGGRREENESTRKCFELERIERVQVWLKKEILQRQRQTAALQSNSKPLNFWRGELLTAQRHGPRAGYSKRALGGCLKN